MQPVSEPSEMSYQFDAFELDPVRRVLLRDGKPIALKPKAFQTLLVLIRNGGRVMDKDQLMQQVWPDTVVEEVNLAHNISVLRKALGQKSEENRFIITVPGRGYGFVAEVTRTQRPAPTPVEAVSEYELTRSRVVVEEDSEARDLPGAFGVYADGAGTRALPAKKAKGTVARALERKRFLLAAALVAIALVITLGLLLYNSRQPQPQPSAQIRSIAVLPFKPLVAESRDESLEMGVADTLIARLGNIREIQIRPISAVRKYAGLEQDALTAGREQRVEAVLDGSIQKTADKVRVTVRLLRVDDGTQLWAETFEEKFKDLFVVQDRFSEKVVSLLTAKLTGQEQMLLTKRHTDNAEAYQLYLKGRYHLNRLTDDGFMKGREYFQQAIEKDTSYALAYAGLAEACYRLSAWNAIAPNDGFPKAKEAALKALELDDNLAEAHTALGNVKLLYDWDWPGAESEFRRAVEINPNHPDTRQMYGLYLWAMGRFEEALAEMTRAQELDPLSLEKIAGIGDIYYYQRRYDQAIGQYQKALEMDPNPGYAHWTLGNVYVHKGMYEQAIVEYQRSIPLSGDSPEEPASLGYAYALAGKRREARQVIDELQQRSKRSYIPPTIIAFIYAGLGEKDQAFAWLEKAYDGRDYILVLLKVEPTFDRLRSDPRFTSLLRRVGLPQ